MKIVIRKTADAMGAVPPVIQSLLNSAIQTNNCARLILSTGASGSETLKILVKLDVDWTKVEMFPI